MRARRAATAALLAAAVALAACGGSGGDENERDAEIPPPVATSVDEIVDVAPKFQRETVRVEGTAVPVSEDWFVLRGEREAVLVSPEPGVLEDDLRRGESVTVLGVVEKFDRLQVAELERLLARGEGTEALRGALARKDAPFISADRVE